jgi:hypothetical protein
LARSVMSSGPVKSITLMAIVEFRELEHLSRRRSSKR